MFLNLGSNLKEKLFQIFQGLSNNENDGVKGKLLM